MLHPEGRWSIRSAKTTQLLYGRTTYDVMASYWPLVTDADNPVATVLNNAPKHVVSRTMTLEDAPWQNTVSVFGDDVVDTGGWNEGFFELASGHEVCAYYDQLLRHQLLPTGRLIYLPTTRHLGGNRFRGLDGSEHTVTIRHRLVDATYLRTVVPAMRPPLYPLSPQGTLP